MFTRLGGLFVLLAIAAGHCPDVAGHDADKPQGAQRPALPIDDRTRSPIFDLPVLGQQPAPEFPPPHPRATYVTFDPKDGSDWDKVPVRKLLEVLKDSNPIRRRLACDALGARGEVGAAGIAALEIAARDSVTAVRRCAVSALGRIGCDPRARFFASRIVPVLVAALADENLTVRLAAISGLGGLKISSKAVENALLDCLKQPLTRDDALLALVSVGPKDKIPLELLAETVRQGKPEARRCAFGLIMARDANDPNVRALLEKFAAGTDDDLRLPAAARLWNLAPTPEVLDVLKAVFRATSDSVAQTLSAPGAPAINVLEQLARKSDPKPRAIAEQILQQIEQFGLRASVLIKALESTRPDERESAARALGKLGPKAKSAVPALARHLGDENDLVRLCSAYALTSIGSEASAAVPDLQQALAQGDVALRSAAAHALASIVPSKKSR